MHKLIIIGAGGLGREIAYAIGRANEKSAAFEIGGYCDDDLLKEGKSLGGLPILGPIETAAEKLIGQLWFICAIGDNHRREAVTARAERLGWRPATVVDPSAMIGADCDIGAGAYIAAYALLSIGCRVGRHAIINYACSLGHDAKVGDYGQVCPGARISGFSVMERGAFVGSNGVLAPGVELGSYAVLGAASFAVRSIPAGATAIGNPARVIIQKDE